MDSYLSSLPCPALPCLASGGHQSSLTGFHSTDGTNFVVVAYGTYIDDQSLKQTVFAPRDARYMRLEVLTEAGGRGAWTAAAEINVFAADGGPPPSPAGNGAWGLTVDFPLVPVSMANVPSSGNILTWSSYAPSTFGGSAGTQTLTATYAPGSNTVTQALVTNTGHDMFCSGLSLDFDGRAIATGGNTAPATSIFNQASASWSEAPVSLPLMRKKIPFLLTPLFLVRT